MHRTRTCTNIYLLFYVTDYSSLALIFFLLSVKERLVQIQVQLGRPTLKLIKEVETRWNSTFLMFERMYGEREPLSAAMSSLQTDVTPLTSAEFAVVEECLGVLSPFNEATVELSTEKKVSASKIIPLMKMLDYTIGEQIPQKKTTMAKELAEHLFRQVREKLNQFQMMSIFTLPTLLDPRFKTLGFLSPSKADEAVQRLTSECTFIISSHTPRPPATQLPTAGEDAGPSTSTGMFSAAHYNGILFSHFITFLFFFPPQVICGAI